MSTTTIIHTCGAKPPTVGAPAGARCEVCDGRLRIVVDCADEAAALDTMARLRRASRGA